MDAATGKVGNVVVLGVQGSGKTVFLSILGHTFDKGGAYGLQLTSDNKTWDYVSDAYKRMRIDYEWPDSTNRGDFVELSWEVKDGTTPLFTINSIDCAGEEIVDALAPSSDGRGKKAEKKARGAEGDGGDSWDADEEGGGAKDVKKLIAERVANASVICLFINPNDFESRIYGEGDDIGSSKDIDEAISRSKDMRRMLLTFLNARAPDGVKRIVLTITQSGRKEVSNQIDELGGAKTYLLEQDSAMSHWSGTRDAHIIAVSAVNKVVFKKKDGEPVEPERMEGVDNATLERDYVIRDPWVGRRDRKRHVVPREMPDVTGENPSSGLVEFLLAVGGPLSPELSSLDEALHRLRESQYAMSRARRDDGATAKERLSAANDLEGKWKTFEALSMAFVRKGRRRDSLRATERYLDEEEAQLLRWIVAEREIDRFLRERAASGGIPPGAAAAVVGTIGKALEGAWAQRTGRHRHCSFMAASGYDLSLTDGWLERQLGTYRENRARALSDFDAAVANLDAAAAQAAMDEILEWGAEADAKHPRQRLLDLAAFLAALAERKKVCSQTMREIREAETRLAEARRLLGAADFAEARLATAAARDVAAKAEIRVRPLEDEKAKYGDAAVVDDLLGKARGLVGESEALELEIDRRETEFKIAKQLRKIDDHIDAATQATDTARVYCKERNFATARQRVADAQARLHAAALELKKVDLLATDERVKKRHEAIEGGLSGCDALTGEIKRLELWRRKLRRCMWIAAASVAAALCLVFWLDARAGEAARMRARWDRALKNAWEGDYDSALALIQAIQDKPGLMLSRASFVDAGDIQRINNGKDFHDGRVKAETALKELAGHAGKMAVEGLSDRDAPKEWEAYLGEKRAAEGKFPKPALDDRLNLPETLDKMRAANEAYAATCTAVADANACFEKFMGAARAAKEAARAEAEKKAREEAANALRKQLDAAVPQGWKAMAAALPKEGVDTWIGLGDAQLRENWNKVLSAGLAPGAPLPVLNAATIKQELDEVRSGFEGDEWAARFADIEKDCLAVLDAAGIIEAELDRRKWVRGSLDDAEAAVAARQWERADSAINMAKKKLSKDRKSDAAEMARADELMTKVNDGRREDRRSELKRQLASVTPPQGWEAMAAALPKGGVDDWLDLDDRKLEAAWNGVRGAGLPRGTLAILNVEGARKALGKLAGANADEESKAVFSEIEKVLDAAEKVDRELARRREVRDLLNEVQNHVDNKAWDSAEKVLEEVASRISTHRKVDADTGNRVEDFRNAIEEGRERDHPGGRTLDERIAKLCPETAPDAPDWNALTDLALSCRDGNPDKAAEVARRLAGWADSWISKARDKRIVADAAISGTRGKTALASSWGQRTSVKGKVSKKAVETLWKNVIEAEGLLDRAEACWQVFQDSGLTSPTGNIGEWIADVRGSLPPVLRVSLYASFYEPNFALDAYNLVESLDKSQCGELHNPETEEKDLLVVPASEGGILSLRFKGDGPSVARTFSFSWEGSRHVAVRLDSPDVKDMPN